MKVLLLLLFLSLSVTSDAQNSYGIYNYSEIKTLLKEEPERWSEDLLKDLTDSVEVLENELISLYKRYIKKHHFTPEEITHAEQALASKNKEIEDFKVNAQTRYYRDQHFNDSLVEESISKTVHQFMTENNLLFLSQHDKVVLCHDCKDYTLEMIAYIQRVRKKQ